MKKKEIREEIQKRLANGEGKQAVFDLMSGKGVSDRVVAHMIASYAAPKLCDQHRVLVGAFMYLLVWGFQNNKAWAYNVTIILTIVNLPKQFKGFMDAPLLNKIALLIGLALFAFTWYVRGKLFPDFLFMSPRKTGKTYVFSS
jgi:hypothetical protein